MSKSKKGELNPMFRKIKRVYWTYE
jgi:hypothetical protein